MLADPAGIDEEFRKAWLLHFCRSGQRETSLDECSFEVDGWLPLLPEVHLPRLIGQMLADVVLRKSAAAGSLDGWVTGSCRFCPLPGMISLLVFLLWLRILEFGLMVCWTLTLP